MRLSDFDYILPPELIAVRPATPRDAARLLLVQNGLFDRKMADLPQLLRAGDRLVFNDTRVIPARLMGKRGEAKIEILLHRDLGGGAWEAFAKPAKKLREDDIVEFGADFTATVLGKSGEFVRLRLNADNIPAMLQRYGTMPVPPYFHRLGDATDRGDYQTVFARADGSVAAPTAGLHFTEDLLARLKNAGIERSFVTLHVGAGTFAPVRVDKIEDHVMHKEWCEVTAQTAAEIAATRARGGRIVAVGTTAARTLESSGDKEFRGETDIFIRPGYRFHTVDALLTNFHLPQSTLLMLVSAFSGAEQIRAAYAHAIEQRYRFYSYGDACLLFP